MNEDFTDFIAALLAAGARFLVVGAHAMAVHGVPRATGDLDVWLESTPRAEQALGSLQIPFLGRADLVRNKKAAGRRKDLADLERLGELK